MANTVNCCRASNVHVCIYTCVFCFVFVCNSASSLFNQCTWMRKASSQLCFWEWTCKCINVTVTPVSLSCPAAQRMRVLLPSPHSATKKPWTLTFPPYTGHNASKHSANVLIQTDARQWCQAWKIWPLCKNQPFKLHRVSVLFFLPLIFFVILCLLFVQACFSSMETGCAIGTESKD